MHKQLNFSTENALWEQGLRHVAGIDEVGRGCLAGPVFMALVVFAPDTKPIKGVIDSKMLSIKARNDLAPQICRQAVYWQVTKKSVHCIDRYNILKATFMGMKHLIDQCSGLDHALIDGRFPNKLTSQLTVPTTFIVKGDQSCYSIAAASILAKVTRDRYMQRLHRQFPLYAWNQNKGYGTLIHRQALLTHGPTPHHRSVFIRKVMKEVNGSH
jgi:ribonuclease HII